MTKRTLEQAFNALFHNNESFADLCSLNIDDEIEKIQIKSRIIYKTSPKFKKYLRFIDKVILKYLQKNDSVVHSYIKEKSTLTAIQAHAKNKYFFITDIEDFFINVTTEDVKNILTRDKHLIPISDFEEFIPTIVRYTTWNGSIPIGFVTSPKLSNAFLLDFDNTLHGLCAKNSLIYTRYSDDIIISGSTLDSLNNIEIEVQEILQECASEKLLLNKNKTRKTHTGNKVKILGLVITPDGRVTIDSKFKKTIELLLYFYSSDKEKYHNILEKELNGKDINEKEHSLFGLLNYAKSIDPGYLEKLQRKYGAYVLSSLMEDKWSD